MVRGLAQLNAIAIVSVVAFSAPAFASDVTLKFLSPGAMRNIMPLIISDFEKSSDIKIQVSYGTVGALTDRIEKGEAADIAIVSDEQANRLANEGKFSRDTLIHVAQVGVGLMVKAGDKRPKIGNAEELKQALLQARTIAYNDPTSGDPAAAYAVILIKNFGLEAETKDKIRIAKSGTLADVVSSGEAQMGFNQISDIVANNMVQLVGPLPADVQHYTRYEGAMTTNATDREAAGQWIAYLASPQSRARLLQAGFEPF